MNRNSMNPLRTTARAVLLGAMLLAISAGTAMACSLANWSTTSGTIIANQPNGMAGDPAGNSDNVPRYAGLCASKAAAGTTSFVQDNRPGGIDRIIARFYVLNGGTSNPVVYRGNSTGGELFDVTLNGSNAVFTAGSASVSDNLKDGWNSIEIDWDSAGNSISMIVNGNLPVSTTGVTTASLANVQLGNLSAAASNLFFDAYEAHLSTPVGRVCRGDSDGSGTRDLIDLQQAFVEIQTLGGTLANGTPDANEDGVINLSDLQTVFTLIQDLQSDCTTFPG